MSCLSACADRCSCNLKLLLKRSWKNCQTSWRAKSLNLCKDKSLGSFLFRLLAIFFLMAAWMPDSYWRKGGIFSSSLPISLFSQIVSISWQNGILKAPTFAWRRTRNVRADIERLLPMQVCMHAPCMANEFARNAKRYSPTSFSISKKKKPSAGEGPILTPLAVECCWL